MKVSTVAIFSQARYEICLEEGNKGKRPSEIPAWLLVYRIERYLAGDFFNYEYWRKRSLSTLKVQCSDIQRFMVQ